MAASVVDAWCMVYAWSVASKGEGGSMTWLEMAVIAAIGMAWIVAKVVL